jgi:hypothetical protein
MDSVRVASNCSEVVSHFDVGLELEARRDEGNLHVVGPPPKRLILAGLFVQPARSAAVASHALNNGSTVAKTFELKVGRYLAIEGRGSLRSSVQPYGRRARFKRKALLTILLREAENSTVSTSAASDAEVNALPH